MRWTPGAGSFPSQTARNLLIGQAQKFLMLEAKIPHLGRSFHIESTLNRHWISLNHPTYKKTESNWHTEISEGLGSFQLARCAPFPLFTRRHFLHGGWSTARGASRFAAIWQHYTPGSAQRATLQPSWQWGKLKRRRRADQTVSVGYKTTDLTHQFDTSDIWLLNLKSLVEVFMDHLLQRGRHWFLLA